MQYMKKTLYIDSCILKHKIKNKNLSVEKLKVKYFDFMTISRKTFPSKKY